MDRPTFGVEPEDVGGGLPALRHAHRGFRQRPSDEFQHVQESSPSQRSTPRCLSPVLEADVSRRALSVLQNETGKEVSLLPLRSIASFASSGGLHPGSPVCIP